MFSRLAKAFGAVDKGKFRSLRVNSESSQYNFSAINMRFNKVQGFFKEAIVDVDFNIHDLENSHLNLRWPVAGIRTGIPERDEQLIKAPHFFDGDHYPEIKFESKAISQEGKNQLVFSGDLTIKEHRKSIALYAGLQCTKEGYQIFIDYSLDRFEFAIGESGSFAIGRQIDLEFDIYLAL